MATYADEFSKEFSAYERMKVCTECRRIYGFWHYQTGHMGSPGDGDYYQKCGCKTLKPDTPQEGQAQEKWQGFDFNEVITLCHSCGQEILRSGSKWSVWFCKECKERVIEFNTQYQTTVIPIGRHSIMAGYKLSGKESQDENKVKEFVTNLNSLFDRIDLLEEWRGHIISRNLKSLGYPKDVALAEYLSKAKNLPERSIAFRNMSDFFMVRLEERDKVNKWLESGYNFLDSRQFQDAIVSFSIAINLDSKNAQAYYGRGCAHRQIQLRECIGFDSTDEDDHNLLAVDDFTRAIRLNPEYADAYFERGCVYYYLSSMDFEAAAKLGSQDAREALTERGKQRKMD
jgi:tetratricopeptide (TPR) repeat protein